MTGITIVDGDGHIMEEPNDIWTAERIDYDRWGDWVPRKEVIDEIYDVIHVGGAVRGGGRELHDQMAAAVGMTPRQFYDLLEGLRRPGGHEPEARLADMDADGIDAAVLYPSLSMFFGPCDEIPALREAAFVADCQRAYNDWLADFCAYAPTRLFGVAAAPLQDVGRACAEVEHAVGRGLRAVFVRPSAYVDELPFNHHVYDDFWSTCQELGAPVAFHPGVHVDTPGACRKFGLVAISENTTVTNMAMDEIHGGSALGQAVGNPVDMIVTMGRLLMGGVCERFPRLKLVFLESSGGWMPSMLERMDEQVQAFPLERRWLSLRPSEYFTRQCYVSFEPEEWNLAAAAEKLGTDRILWASDYPHPEYHPGVLDELRERIAPLAPSDQARILGANAIECYGLQAVRSRV
ncbi:MAG TPA: amidohydrolase family protein [Acidimicrobiia bacterium]